MKCRRCGKEFDTPYPEIKNGKGILDIATVEWCASCNEFAMHILYRGTSAYKAPKIVKKEVRDVED